MIKSTKFLGYFLIIVAVAVLPHLVTLQFLLAAFLFYKGSLLVWGGVPFPKFKMKEME